VIMHNIKLTEKQREFLKARPSELLKIALGDLIKCEKSPKYKINMNRWVDYGAAPNMPCHVCLAGAALVKEFDAKELITPCQNPGYTDKQADRLQRIALGLNDLRIGNLYEGLETLGIPKTKLKKIPHDCAITDYHTDNFAFKKDMRKLVKFLQDNDL
jgi:hypothetical protein